MLEEAIRAHPRTYAGNRYVYPVLSRRARGISVGVNLNPDKVCNFECVYCQVDRHSEPEVRTVHLDRVEEELSAVLEEIRSGLLFERRPFAGVPEPLRRLNDIAFSGDGEPTAASEFPTAVRRVVGVKEALGLRGVKVLVLTNGSTLDRPAVREALALLDGHEGEVWAKLDAGTEAHYREISRSRIPFGKILENLCLGARERPLVIQSCFFRWKGEAPPASERAAYVERLKEILETGGRLRLIQVYTLARPPAEQEAQPLLTEELEAIAAVMRPLGVPVKVFGGTERACP
ncbi:MAG: radical SAM protein [Nitrospirae bacterium]|nr:radical SAM protein [Nitrospirota bacterium]